MFYFFFLFTVFIVVVFLWLSSALYKIFYYHHKADIILSKIIVLLRNKDEAFSLILNSLNDLNDEEKMLIFSLKEAKKAVENEKNLVARLRVEKEIDQKIDELKTKLRKRGNLVFSDFDKYRQLLSELVKNYNKMVMKHTNVCEKAIIKTLVQFFHLKPLYPYDE